MGNWGTEELGNWGTEELRNWGSGEVGKWGTEELGNWGTGELGKWVDLELGEVWLAAAGRRDHDGSQGGQEFWSAELGATARSQATWAQRRLRRRHDGSQQEGSRLRGSWASRAFVVLLVGLRRTAVALAEPGEDQAELRSVGIVPVRSSGWFSSPSVHAATLSLAARRSLT